MSLIAAITGAEAVVSPPRPGWSANTAAAVWSVISAAAVPVGRRPSVRALGGPRGLFRGHAAWVHAPNSVAAAPEKFAKVLVDLDLAEGPERHRVPEGKGPVGDSGVQLPGEPLCLLANAGRYQQPSPNRW